jgi:hypothetical protein
VWGTSPRTAAVWAVRRLATANAKGAATPRTATSIWPGRLWRRPTLQALSALDPSLLSEKESQDQWHRGAQSGGAQAVPGLLLHPEGPGPV